MYYIPTYDEAVEICQSTGNFNFYETKHIVSGYPISIFNYRLTTPEMFRNPILNNPNIDAHELRGLCFVFEKDSKTLYKRYLLLNKFFNLNQTENSSYLIVKDEKIKEVTYKEDGSIVSFIELPNKEIIAKSKASFESYQALETQGLFNSDVNIQKLVKWCLDRDVMPVFEYVSPTNRVVLQYKITDLILIKLRNNLTGEYILTSELPSEIINGVSIVKTFNFTLDEIISKCETDTGYEGYVITFESGKMIKLKLQEYCALHNLHTEDLHKEDSIIYLIIEEQIDDILCQLDEADERRKMILDLIDVVNKHVSRKFNETTKLLENFDGNVKEFVLRNKKDINFQLAMIVINHGHDLLKKIKEKVLRETYFLMNARKWIKYEKSL